jgi:hypothetical protein
MIRRAVIGALSLLALASVGTLAQSTDSSAKRPTPVDPRDTLFLRARQAVLEGNGEVGRKLVDSALTAAAGTSDYGVALYWRAALAATAADAERDYRRLIVEYPFSLHSGDALLALAQLEMARGDRDAAIGHLQRFLVQEGPSNVASVRAGIWLGRLLLEQNQLAKGCAVLLRARATLGDTAVETRNQVDYYAARCTGVDTAAIPTPRRSPPAAGAARPTAPPAPTTATGKFTVQVAAYDTRLAAEHLVTKLAERSIVARVAGTSAPYRVRIGRYGTEAEAIAAARQLKTKGIEGFVTSENETAAPPPPR